MGGLVTAEVADFIHRGLGLSGQTQENKHSLGGIVGTRVLGQPQALDQSSFWLQSLAPNSHLSFSTTDRKEKETSTYLQFHYGILKRKTR